MAYIFFLSSRSEAEGPKPRDLAEGPFYRHPFCALSLHPFAMKQYRAVLNFFAGSVITFFVLSQFAFKNNEEKQINEESKNQWHTPAIPDQLSFASEPVPMQRWDIREKF